MRSLSFAIAFILVASFATYGQNYGKQYQTAKEFFDKGNYSLAMEVFKSLIVYDRENPYSEYASYFYAVSAYRQNYPAVAKDMFLQLKQLHPTWEKMPEVNYWLAKIYFDQQQYFQAMNILNDMPLKDMAQDASNMKSHYLKKIEDVETLRMMWEEHPLDSTVGNALARAIAQKPILEQDSKLMDSVINFFDMDRSKFAATLKPVSVFKDRYIVSLLFPFLAKSLEPTPGTKVNQSILDLYAGIRMAVDTLKALGIDIELRSYDTERNVETTRKILQMEEVKSSDLLVGPLFPNQLDLVREFSINNRINMINPVSSNFDFVSENPFGILFLPSYETIGRQSAKWMASQLKNKNCMVFFGDTPKDSVAAYAFMEKARELELNLVWAEEVSVEKSATIFSRLATPVEYDEFKNPIEFELKIDSIGGIFVASDNALIYTKVISGVETRGDSVLVMGNKTWLDNAAANFETYERLHITMAAPNFIQEKSVAYQKFRKEFLQHHKNLPTEYSSIGFEFMMFVGQALSKHGAYFQDGIRAEDFIDGYMSLGYKFEDLPTNEYVPFIHFENGELHVLNPKGLE